MPSCGKDLRAAIPQLALIEDLDSSWFPLSKHPVGGIEGWAPELQRAAAPEPGKVAHLRKSWGRAWPAQQRGEGSDSDHNVVVLAPVSALKLTSEIGRARPDRRATAEGEEIAARKAHRHRSPRIQRLWPGRCSNDRRARLLSVVCLQGAS